MDFRQKRRWTRIAVWSLVIVAAFAFALAVRGSTFGQFLELKTYDFRFAFRGGRTGSPDPPITILAVDPASLDHISDPLMLWHRHFASAINALVQGGASAVGIDFILSDIAKLDAEGQQALSESILNAGQAGMPLVLGYRVKNSGVEQPAEAIRFAAFASGHAFAFLNLTTDNDDFVRRQQLKSAGADGSSQPSFALAIANAFRMRNAKPPIEPASPEPMLINFRERDHFPHESFYAALEAASKNDLAYLKSKFGGRIVLIAFLGEQGDEDLTSTPHYYWRTGAAAGTSRRTPGIEIHANTIATLLNDDPIVPLETWKQNLVALAVVGLIALAGAVWPPLPSTIASAGILAFLFYAAVFWAFAGNTWMRFVSPAAGGICAFGLSQTANFVLEGRARRRLRRVFGRYVDDRVIEKILQDSDAVALTGSRKQVAVLFADIRSFTTRSEKASAEDIVWMLNEYFTAMVEAVQNHSGTVNSLMGDGLMAIFGAPLDDADAAFHSVEAAREMIKSLPGINLKLKEHGFQPIDIGIGIHFGEVVVGSMGSPRKMEYTAIGDVVNTASRVESLTRQVDAQILVTGELFAAAGNRIQAEPVGDFVVKGRLNKISAYRV